MLIKYINFLVIAIVCLFSACDDGKEKQVAGRKELEVQQREQALLTREQLVAQREADLQLRERQFDSLSGRFRDSAFIKQVSDSIFRSHPAIPGTYNVTMRCTETNCTGSAVGDTKNEQWDIAYEDNFVTIKAMSDKKLVRSYKGGFLGNGIELEAQPDSLTTVQSGKIIVRIQETKDNRLEGVREITREDDCRIIYALDLRKQ